MINPQSGGLPRRQFVQSLLATGALAALPMAAQANPKSTHTNIQTLNGQLFDLTLTEKQINVSGSPARATLINDSMPGPTLHWQEGETVTIRVHNQMSVASSIHWHGILLPNSQDGVPGMTMDAIMPGETFTYQFPLKQSGSYWYHSHSLGQEQTGLFGAIVIHPKNPEPIKVDRDYVIVLSDWSDEDPMQIYGKLKKLSSVYNLNERTLGEFADEVREVGFANAMASRDMWNQMRMNARDISDVTGATFKFLMNGETSERGWMGACQVGEKVRLRFINAGAMTIFDVRIPDTMMNVVATDGQLIVPFAVDEFRIGAAECYDVVVEIKSPQPLTLFAQAIDRSGFARGTLSVDPAMLGVVPALDPVPLLTHGDMGMNHGGGGMSMDHSQHGGMKMDHANMDHGNMGVPVEEISAVTFTDQPEVDMIAEGAQFRYDDPGVGLRENGRKVLTYAMLKPLIPLDLRPPTREIKLNLTGNMMRYIWSIDGITFSNAQPIKLALGERVRFTLINHTMMNHPFHLHGFWSQLELTPGVNHVNKHTVIVQPGAKVSFLVDADTRGRWPFHCHLLLHMLGMFREVRVI